MARANISMNIIEEKHGHQTEDDDGHPLIKYYKATALVPAKPPPLHHLLDRQPAAWASVQITSGILSFGLGVVFAVMFGLGAFLLTLFRVPLLTGIIFLTSGFLSNLLYKHPGLLQICLYSNILCLVVGAIGAVLLCVDLAKHEDDLRYKVGRVLEYHQKVEIVVMCVTVLNMIISSVLIFFMQTEIRKLEKKSSSSRTH